MAGIQYRRDDARTFAAGRGLTLEFERDSSNQHDRNAIKIIGCCKGFFGTKQHFVGYVPSDVAADIVEGGYYGKVLPRLLKTYVGDSGFVEILFQVLGPKGERLKYKRVDPASLPQAALGKEAHYTTYVDQVKYLKQERRYSEAIDLLLKLVAETEKEAKRENAVSLPGTTNSSRLSTARQSVAMTRSQILERYESQPKAPGVGPAKMAERLKRAKEKRNADQA